MAGCISATARGPACPEHGEHLGTQRKNDAVESRWRLSARGCFRGSHLSFTGSGTSRWSSTCWRRAATWPRCALAGRTGWLNPRLVTNPFYPAERRTARRGGQRLAGATPLFLTGNTDWYLSNASILWAANAMRPNGVTYNGGTRYMPLTDGKRNDCFERFFLTVSPRYEEVLPIIPNPPSPWKHVTGTRVWRAHGACNREQDARYWTDVHRLRHDPDGRHRPRDRLARRRRELHLPHPGRAGQGRRPGRLRLRPAHAGQARLRLRPLQQLHRLRPGERVLELRPGRRASDNQLQHAWMRCYAPKPARAVEYCARLAPQIQGSSTSAPPTATCTPPSRPGTAWTTTRACPGAGTFAAVFYAYGEIMLHQKKAWNGPVYSEGNYHCFYCGLTDGNYGQDQSYRPAENPWLVDFDLRKMHDLGCNFGMGNPEMFYANAPQPRGTPEQRDA